MKIGVDFDGVITQCAKIKAYTAEKRFGVKIYWANFKREVVVGNKWLTEAQYNEVSAYAYGSWRYAQLMEFAQGAKLYLSILREQGHDLFIITSRTGVMFDVADRWLQKEGLCFIPRIGVGYGQDKSPILEILDIEAYIDDDLDKLEPAIGKVKYLFLFSWPYNEDAAVPPEIEIIPNDLWRTTPSAWKLFYQRICQIAEQHVGHEMVLAQSRSLLEC